MPNSFDELIEGTEPKNEKPKSRPYNAEEYKSRKNSERETIYDLVNDTAEKMKNSPELFQSYLDVQARFDRYSASNAILVTAQKPEATRLADFDTWKAADTNVNKGEKAISILEPGKEFTRSDGSTGVNYNIKKVFDISQTNAKEQTAPVVTRDERLIIKSLISNAPCTMKISDNISPQLNAIYNPDEKTIYVRSGLDAPILFRALTQELVHAHLDKGKGKYSRNDNQLAAFYASYILCKRYGVPADGYNFVKMPSLYSGMTVKDFRTELGRIRDVAGDISRDMNRTLQAPERAKKERSDEAR